MDKLKNFSKGLGIVLLLIFGVLQFTAGMGGSPETYQLRAPIPASKYTANYREPTRGISIKQLVYDGSPYSYYYYVPSTLKSHAPRPVLLLLHGSNRTGASMIDMWRPVAEEAGVLLIAPNATDRMSWSLGDDPPDALRAMVYDMHKMHPVDGRRIYLFGHSAGAIYALYLSVTQSAYFAATAVHAGAWGFNLAMARLKAMMAERPIPIAIFIGTQDTIFPLPDVRYTAKVLDAGGLPVSLYEIQGHNHWYYDNATFINRQAWATLSSHMLKQVSP